MTGLIFPNAEGYRDPHNGDLPVIYSTFPDGNEAMMAMGGEQASFGGGSGPGDDERWNSFCTRIPVDDVFYVQDTPFPLP